MKTNLTPVTVEVMYGVFSYERFPVLKMAREYKGFNSREYAKELANLVDVPKLKFIRDELAVTVYDRLIEVGPLPGNNHPLEQDAKACYVLTNKTFLKIADNIVKTCTDDDTPELYRQLTELCNYIHAIETAVECLMKGEPAMTKIENFFVFLFGNIFWYLPTLAFAIYVGYDKIVYNSVENNVFLSYMLLVVCMINIITLCHLYNGLPKIRKGKRVR